MKNLQESLEAATVDLPLCFQALTSWAIRDTMDNLNLNKHISGQFNAELSISAPR